MGFAPYAYQYDTLEADIQVTEVAPFFLSIFLQLMSSNVNQLL